MRSSWTTINCTSQHRSRLARLIARARWQHKHVDWIDTLDMIGQEPFLLAMQAGEPIGCLACPPDPPGISWLRLFAVAPHYDAADIWDLLWPEAEESAKSAGVKTAAVLIMSGWLVAFLMRSGFNQTNSVVFLEKPVGGLPAKTKLSGFIRAFQATDLPRVVELDNLAFEPIWQYSNQAMSAAHTHSSLALVAEQDHELAGYIIVSASALGVHIARLAVAPKWQRRGFASDLVRHAMEYAFESGATKITVNTQADNLLAQNLYLSLGFQITDQSFPVWTKRIS